MRVGPDPGRLVAAGRLGVRILGRANYLIGIPNFFEKVNDFDHVAIVKQAQKCKIP